jgi:hypothetical protein
MRQYVVTVKLKKNPNHDPHNKVAGLCPLAEILHQVGECSDSTGEHHTFLYEDADHTTAEMVHRYLSGQFHITRVEEVI